MATYNVSFPGLGIGNLAVDRVAFRIFGLEVFWYGILISLAVLACVLLAMRDSRKFGLVPDDILDTVIAIVPLMIVFARLYYVIFEWDMFKGNLLSIFSVRSGGLAFYGGVLGGALAVILVSRIKKIRLTSMIDFLVVYIPLGQAIGRWGNFFNQEAFGVNTTLPWGMYSNGTEAYLRTLSLPGVIVDPTAPVHPTFLYEFLANMLIFFLLLRIRKQSKTPLEPMFWYFLLYGFVRFFVESIRTDPLFIGQTNLRASMVLSAAMVIVSLVILAVMRSRRLSREYAEALAGEASADQVPETEDGSGPVSAEGEPAEDGQAADEPDEGEPAADEPAADEPAADEPAADEPAADEAGTEPAEGAPHAPGP